ncbi:MAG: hypothetical protein MK116_05180 [Phycisphaerales bacterium]|nr:hypothetical protein [Phycisphaerales bacterium]
MISCLLMTVLVLSDVHGTEARIIRSDRQLLVDHHLIDTMDGVRLELGAPRDEGPVFHFDEPWEGPFCGYSTVIQDGDRYLLYYRGLPEAGADGTSREVTCVATSTDGVTWSRPELDLFEVDGSRQNNVVLADAAPVTHNFSPFLDTRAGVAAEHRFKGLGGNEHTGLIAYVSPDGLHWTRLQDDPVVTGGMFDSQNVAFWSDAEQQYVCYLRTWTGGGYSGYRTISRSTSPDFLEWTEPVPMDFGDTPLEHLYTNQTHPYFRAPQIYVAVAARFMPGRQVISDADAERLGVNPRYFKDCSDAVLMTSRGGEHYDRTFMESFIRPGIGLENWVSRSNYPALNIVQTGPAEMSLYVNQNYAQPTAELRRYSMRLDGLASMSAGAAGGEWRTHPLVFDGDHLEINFATSARGGIQVEIQDESGTPIPGYTLAESIEQIGNEIDRVVAWTSGTDVSSLAGRPVRLRFVMQDADLYAFQFAPGPLLAVESVEEIWRSGPHNAFTDLLEVDGRLYCTFREGESHVGGTNGTIRVIRREEDGRWTSVALLEEPGIDLRDPKLSLAPDGRIMLSCGASDYDGPTLRGLQSRVAFGDPVAGEFGSMQPVVIDEAIRSDRDWLWRVTWHKGIGYGVVYQATASGTDAHLVSTRDGVNYDLVSTLDVAADPNEVSLQFTDEDELIALIRRDSAVAVLGRSSPPYAEWTFTDLPERLGGPGLVQWTDDTWLVSARQYRSDGPRTILGELGNDGRWEVLATLPSGGDTSYPGLVRRGDTVWVSYYSSHEGQARIYLARVTIRP